ncbi:uncharacterized protein LOC110990917 [Acanthaster planci]|uniref:Uncharacterized protein LOC110990917 n=1 Tax=Acanthaster planci TaxID=133434 RepID=A0A8B8A440_ACAPL|nr:uncharacterized protein LOC110990917 [Acanthaster planci]
MADRACRDIIAKEEEEIAKIKNKSCLLREKLKQITEQRDKKFVEIQKSNHDHINRAEQIVATVNDLMRQADDFELLDLKPKVMHNLQFQEKLQLNRAQLDLSFIGVKYQDVVRDLDLGEIMQEEKWQLKVEFGEGRGDRALNCATDVAFMTNGDVTVTDTDKKQVMIFTSSGKYKGTLGRDKLEDPWGTAVTCDNLLLVTDGKHVKMFDSDLEFVRQLSPVPKDAQDYADIDVCGIAVDKQNRIAVADRGRKLISLHNLDGSLITTIAHGMVAWGLAVGVQECVIFANYHQNKLICVTYQGTEKFSVSTSFNGKPVWPYGVCCSETGDIYVTVDTALEGGIGKVLQYTPEGIFVGQVADGLFNPYGLSFAPNRDLAAADQVSLKIYQRVTLSTVTTFPGK